MSGMLNVYYLFIAVVLAVGVFLAGLYWRQMLSQYKRLRTRFTPKYKWRSSQLELYQILDLIERRLGLLDHHNKYFHDKIDEIEKLYMRREKDRKSKVKKQVIEYLDELRTDK